MFHTLTQEKDTAVIYDDVEDLVFLQINNGFEIAYTDDYTKQELVDILRRLADSLEKIV